MSGRPLRFLAATLGGWTLMRVVCLWPTIDGVPALIRAVAPPIAAAIPSLAAAAPTARPVAAAPATLRATINVGLHVTPPPTALAPRAATPGDPRRIALALAGLVRFGPATVEDDDASAAGAAAGRDPVVRSLAVEPARLAGSSWLIARGGAGNASFGGGQLGGSQGGVRLTYALGEARRVALAARLSSPLAGTGREASIGAEWQPTGLPLRLVLERRVALDGARGGTAAGVIGGVGPVEVAPGFRLEAYAQAGAIARTRVEGFADASARMMHPAATVAGLRVDLGAGAWGGAQRGATRLDLGPSLAVALPIAGRSLRLAVDWRQRVAGRARPGSGPALSIGSDF